VLVECFLCPLWKAFYTFIVIIVETEIVRKLSPNNELFKEGISGFPCSLSLDYLKGNPLGRDMTKVKIGGKI
jgi:hypothetical protein